MGISGAEIIAILLGLVCGAVMTAGLVGIPEILKKRALKKGKEYTQNDFMSQEMAYSYAALIFTFVVCSVSIFVYNQVAPDTFVWFSVTAVVFYLVGCTAHAMRKLLKERKNTEKQ